MSHRLKWATGMTLFGVVVAVAVLAETGSLWWALVGLLAAGIAGNMLAHSQSPR